METAEPALAEGVGARLRHAREQRGLSVEQCAERLYVAVSLLQAMEGEQFAALGAGVYARGHLRRYAGLLEIDVVGLEQLMEQRLAAAPDLTSIVTRRVGNSESMRRLGLLPVAIVAVVLALAALVWWSSRHVGEPAPALNAAPATSAEPAAPPAAPTAAPGPSTLLPRAAPVPAAGDPGMAAVSSPQVDAPLVVATASPPPVRQPAAEPRAVAPPASVPPAGKSGSVPAAPRRGVVTPEPAKPSPLPPRETQSDYMNFDL